MRILALLCAALLAGAASAQPPSCWTNAEGVTECGTRPPPGVETREVRTPRPAQQPVDFDEDDEEGPARDPLAGVDEETRQRLLVRQRQCELAREVLRTYENADILYDTDDEGNRIEIDEEAQAAVVEEAREAVVELCGPGG